MLAQLKKRGARRLPLITSSAFKLKDELDGKLDIATPVLMCDDEVGTRNVSFRSIHEQVCMVQDVVKLTAELELVPLVQPKRLVKRHVHIPEARTAESIALAHVRWEWT